MFPPETFKRNLGAGQGWVLDPAELDKPKERPADTAPPEPEAIEDIDALKERARQLGVNSWHRYKDPEKLRAAIQAKESESEGFM